MDQGWHRLALSTLLAAALGGCSAAERLASVGQQPELTTIENPVHQPGYRQVAMPMPAPEPMVREANSLWRPGARAFFRDQRASRIGDILTVNIIINDKASLENETERTRDNSEDADLTSFLGYEGSLSAILPQAVDPANLASLGSSSTVNGSGEISRKENINLVLAAVVTQILPNGNLVVQGSQEVRVNFETRVLAVQGIVRPEDITSDNTVRHTQMAEARISYGGRGQITDVQQARYGQQVFDILFPF